MNFHDERQKIKDRSVALHVDLDSEQNAVDATIQYYEEHAEEFTTNTLNADMASIRSRCPCCCSPRRSSRCGSCAARCRAFPGTILPL